ncbi:hypothetical protein ACWGJ2_32030 [Streptomyces sp. NPDC054796]
MVGTVTVGDWSPHTPATAARFRAHYTAHRAAAAVPGAVHPHVHGANLAVRADAYTAVGGFPRVPTGEDRALVAALDAAGWRVRRTEAHPVLTSARRVPRAPGGFGDFLLGMEALEALDPLERLPSREPPGRGPRRPAYEEGRHAGSGRHV